MYKGEEKRKFLRADYPCLITVSDPNNHDLCILTHTENISLGGACVVLDQRVQSLGEIDLELDLKDTLANIHLKGRVAWVSKKAAVRGQEGLRYEAGIQFIDLKEEDASRIERIVRCRLGKSGL